MPKRTVVELYDLLHWRIETLRFLNLYAGCDEGEPSAEEIRTCMGRIILEMETILEHTEGEDRRTPGNEGPLGPLPPYLSDVLGGGPADAL